MVYVLYVNGEAISVSLVESDFDEIKESYVGTQVTCEVVSLSLPSLSLLASAEALR
jgi:hypothetical protein